MLGLGISLARGAFASIVTYVKDGLKLFYNFTEHQDNPITHASTGSTSFDGVDDYVDTGTWFVPSTTDFTLSCWAYSADWSGDNDVMIWYGDATSGGGKWTALALAFGKIEYSVDDNSTKRVAQSGSLSGSGWKHIVGVRDVGSTIKLYIDGVEIASTTDDGNAITNSSVVNTYIGVGSNSGSVFDYYNGSIANVGIWSRALSASEVQGIMYKKYADLGSVDKASLVSWWGLDEDYNDAHGSNNGTNSGSTLTASVYGGNAPSKPRILDSAPDSVKNYGTLKSGTALSFDGSNDYVDTGDTFDDVFNDSFTISGWYKFTDGQPSGTGVLFGGSDANNVVQLYLKTDGALHGNYGADGTSTEFTSSTSLFNNGQESWHHIVYKVDDSTSQMYLYVDGENITLAGSPNDGDLSGITMGNFSNTTNNIAFGARNTGSIGLYLSTMISNIQIFNSALTLSEIQEMYLNPEQILPTGVSSSNLKLHLPMNEGAGAYNYDGSGNQNHGTISGATWATGESGHLPMTALVRQNSPMVFDGSDDVVSISDNSAIDFGTGDFTLSAWIKTSGDGWMRIVDKRDASSGYTFNVDTSERIHLELNDGGGNTGYSASTDISDDLWHHIVASADRSGNVTFYLDGSSDGTADISAKSGSIDSTSDLFIGADAPSGTGLSFDGNINEVAIWDVALDADAVTALYNSGTPLDATTDSGNYDNSDGLQGYWRNDGDTTWTDRSTNSNHGTVSGSPDSIVLTEGITSGRDSQGFYLTDTTENCLTLNGAEAVNADNILTQIGTDTSGSIEAWVKPQDGQPSSKNIFFGIGDTDADENFHLVVDANGTLKSHMRDGGATKFDFATDSAVWANGESTWKHIVLTQNGTAPIIYVDGVAPAQTFSTSTDKTVWLSDLSGIDNVRIGCRNYNSGGDGGGAGTFFSGSIDDFRYYSNKALSSDEVTKNYNAGKSKH